MLVVWVLCFALSALCEAVPPSLFTTPTFNQPLPGIHSYFGASSSTVSPLQLGPLSSIPANAVISPLPLDANDQFNFNMVFSSANSSYFFNLTTSLRSRFVLSALNTSAATAYLYSQTDGAPCWHLSVDNPFFLSFRVRPVTIVVGCRSLYATMVSVR
jgi:hypothetical protein